MSNTSPSKEDYSYNRASSAPLVRAVLTGGYALRPIQRVGVIVISTMTIGWGAYFAADALDAMNNDSPRFLIFGAPSLILIAVGFMGLANGLRFKKGKPH